jgi:hypothetical protein
MIPRKRRLDDGRRVLVGPNVDRCRSFDSRRESAFSFARSDSHGFANSDWPYKCYQAMSEPIADRAVRLMKDEELWR